MGLQVSGIRCQGRHKQSKDRDEREIPYKAITSSAGSAQK